MPSSGAKRCCGCCSFVSLVESTCVSSHLFGTQLVSLSIFVNYMPLHVADVCELNLGVAPQCPVLMLANVRKEADDIHSVVVCLDLGLPYC